ncbi:TetR family transcriptional regulator [Rhodovulum imhoffii]|uniref:TetR family transcriptional regulator n=1 Tax=Rhodovulum imhoffii TaxID=365340 RepID=A0A2T5BNV7_9RHOB|nr:TetR/AcrR family transcriptional regulator [Rhodovulum imhoffii]MBK5932553.1 hypothetical protein [Rhodovulum imhoffii]PTN00694.1 TetR family transcriptional regulator [Rhodovulum imhoffii]
MSQQVPSRRGRPLQLTPENRTARILDATEAVLARDGLKGASMAAVAAEAGMSKRTLYILFKDRAALLTACMQRITLDVVSPLNDAQRGWPLRDRLRTMLRLDMPHLAQRMPLSVLRALVAETPRLPEIASGVLNSGVRASQRLIAREIAHAQTRRELHPGDPQALARLLYSMAYEDLFQKLIDPEHRPPTQDEADARLDLALEIFLNGAQSSEEVSPSSGVSP